MYRVYQKNLQSHFISSPLNSLLAMQKPRTDFLPFFYLVKLPASPLVLTTMWTRLAMCQLTSVTCHMAQLTALALAVHQVTNTGAVSL